MGNESQTVPLVAITGSGGFIGTNLTTYLESVSAPSVSVRARHESTGLLDFQGAEVVIHLAGIAHTSHPDEQALWNANALLPLRIAEQARASGVKQFVFFSSALVWGSTISRAQVETKPEPVSGYGRAKMAAETFLDRLRSDTFIVTVIRPPLVYGPGVRGNLLTLLRAVARWPYLPFGITDNRRSLVSVQNLSAFVHHLLVHPRQGCFSITEKEPFSTADIASNMAEFLPRSGKIIRPPPGSRQILSTLRPRNAKQLFGSFEIDPDTWEDTGFRHPFDRTVGFRTMVKHYLENSF